MKSVHVAAGLAVVAATFASGPDAVASEQITVTGRSCGFEVGEVAPGVYAGQVFGGPILASTPREPVTGIYLLCTVQVNEPAHSGPDSSVTTSWGVGTTSVAPTPVTFQAAPADVIVLCTEIWVDTGGGHASAGLDQNGNVFVDFDDSQPKCAEQVNVALPGGGTGKIWDCPPYDSRATDPLWEVVDPILCSMLAVVFPPEGDIGSSPSGPSRSLAPVPVLDLIDLGGHG